MPARVVLDSPLSRYLGERGIAHVWLVGRLGMPRWRFHRIEAGITAPPPGYYERIAAILGCSVEAIRHPSPAAPRPPARRRKRRAQRRGAADAVA